MFNYEEFNKIYDGMHGQKFMDDMNENFETVTSLIEQITEQFNRRIVSETVEEMKYENGHIYYKTAEGTDWILLDNHSWGTIDGNLEDQIDLWTALQDRVTRLEFTPVSQQVETNRVNISTLQDTTKLQGDRITQNEANIETLQGETAISVKSDEIKGLKLVNFSLYYTLNNLDWVPVQVEKNIVWGDLQGSISNQTDLIAYLTNNYINNTTFDNKVAELENSIATLDSSSETFTEHIGSTENPHSVTKEQVGLGNVDNTADLDKPVSNPQKEYIDAMNDSYVTNKKNTRGIWTGSTHEYENQVEYEENVLYAYSDDLPDTIQYANIDINYAKCTLSEDKATFNFQVDLTSAMTLISNEGGLIRVQLNFQNVDDSSDVVTTQDISTYTFSQQGTYYTFSTSFANPYATEVSAGTYVYTGFVVTLYSDSLKDTNLPIYNNMVIKEYSDVTTGFKPSTIDNTSIIFTVFEPLPVVSSTALLLLYDYFDNYLGELNFTEVVTPGTVKYSMSEELASNITFVEGKNYKIQLPADVCRLEVDEVTKINNAVTLVVRR